MRAEIYDIETNKTFWEIYPELKILRKLGVLYKEDKSKNKIESAKLMWCIHLCCNPNSKLYNVEEKWEVVSEKILGKKDFDWKSDNINSLIEDYKDAMLTTAQKSLYLTEELLIKRSKSLQNQAQLYESLDKASTHKERMDFLKEIKIYDDMLGNTTKLMTEYTKIKKMIEEENSKSDKNVQTTSMLS